MTELGKIVHEDVKRKKEDDQLKFNFTDAIREKQNQLKIQAKNQLMNKWRQLTEGSGPKTFGSIFGSSKHLTLSVKVIAPHIVLPAVDDNFELHVDLGYWKIQNSAIKAEDGMSINSSEFDEFMTPPEEESDLELEEGPVSVPNNQIDNLNLDTPSRSVTNGHIINNQHYDVYQLEIKSLQIALGEKTLPWFELFNRGHGPNHILNSINFALEVKRQIILSYTDSAWLELQGTLDEFVLNMSFTQATLINSCIKNLESEEEKKIKLMRKTLVASGQLTQSKQAYNELDEKERKKLDKIKEQRQVLADFMINKIIINLTENNSSPICAIQLENLKWQLVKKPLSGSTIFSMTSFVLVDHKASELGDDYHFIISANNNVGIDLKSGTLIDSGLTTPCDDTTNQITRSMVTSMEMERIKESESQNSDSPNLQSAIEQLAKDQALMNAKIDWFHSSSPDLQDKPVGVSYQTVDVQFSSFDIVFQPLSWASTASTVDKIMKSLSPDTSSNINDDVSYASDEASPIEEGNDNTKAKPWHTTFNLEIETIHLLFTRILKRGPFKDSPQKIVSMEIKNTHTTITHDQNDSIHWGSKIKSIVAHDITNANPSAAERSGNVHLSKRNPYKPARIFTIGQVGTYSTDADTEEHAFHYIYPGDQPSSLTSDLEDFVHKLRKDDRSKPSGKLSQA